MSQSDASLMLDLVRGFGRGGRFTGSFCQVDTFTKTIRPLIARFAFCPNKILCSEIPFYRGLRYINVLIHEPQTKDTLFPESPEAQGRPQG